MKILLKSFLFIFILAYQLFGQGVITGVVTEVTNNAPLFGANVHLKNTALGSSTDMEGKFKITGISPGAYNLSVSYIGYKAQIISVEIKDVPRSFEVKLFPDVIEGAEVVVTAQLRGQVAAINQQLSSNTIVNVVSEERLQELPDVNAAEVIGRLPGVSLQRSGGEANKVVLRGLSDKFSNITIDGIKIAPTDADSRGVDLSTISQGSLAGVELFKALTPDKDADAIAGSVNFVTKKAPSERLLRLDAKGAYNKLNNTLKQYEFTLRYGERFFDDLFGVQLSGNLERRDRSKENLNLTYNTNLDGQGTDFEITDFGLNFTDETRKRNGLSLFLDFVTPDGGSIKFNNVYNMTNRNYINYSRNYPTGGNIDLQYNARDIETDIKTFNSSIHGENYFLGNTALWGVSFAQSLSENPYDYSMVFSEPPIIENGQVISRMKAIPDSLRKGPPEALIPYALNNFKKASMSWGRFTYEKNLDKEKTAFVNLLRKYSLMENISGELKIGGKYSFRNRSKVSSQIASAYYLDPFRIYTKLSDGTVVQKNFAGTRFDNLMLDNGKILLSNFLDAVPVNRNIYDKYSLYPLIVDGALRDWYILNKNGVASSNGADAEYKPNNEADADAYNIIERVSAGYIMNTFNFGQNVTFIAGLRVESENNDYTAKYSLGPLSGFPTPTGTLKDTSASFSESVVMPNFHLNIRPTDFMNIRFATYKALARPDFNYRLEKAISRNSGSGITGVPNVINFNVGNSNLKAATAWNYEVNTSFFGNDIGLITISAFYKDIKNMYHMVNGVPTSGQKLLDSLGITWTNPFPSGIQYALSYPYNSTKPTRVWGFEWEHQANFRFLPGYFQNLVLNYNFSIVRSETYITTSKIVTDVIPYFPFQKLRIVLSEVKQKLEGQPELFGNVALGYDIGGFSARLSVFYQGEFNILFSTDGRNDQIQDSFTRWDFVVKQQVNDNISFLLNVNNFTSYVEETSLKNRIVSWDLLNTSEKYGLTADLGVRITF